MQLTTPRLILRDFTDTDWRAVLAYQQDERYLRYNPWENRTEADVQAFVQMFMLQQTEQPRRKYQFAVVSQATGELIGNCGIRKNPSDWLEAEIGYELAPDQWGQGYATEAARRVVTFGFAELELHRIHAWCIAENQASAHVLEKLGMRLEGHHREKEWMKGRWWDTLQYAILEREWDPALATRTHPAPPGAG